MLYLVGIGLREGDLSQRGKEVLESCEEVYTDTYTSIPYRIFGKKADRELVESDYLIELAREKDVALAVPGDPLFATTHLALFMEARRRGIDVEVIHAPSIINAVARTGLSLYKFGRIITVGERFMPSDVERVMKNLEAGLHTLVLFDPSQQVEHCVREIFSHFENSKIVVCSKLGTGEDIVLYGDFEHVMGRLEAVEPPACAIIPAKMHFFEEEFLNFISTSQQRQQR